MSTAETFLFDPAPHTSTTDPVTEPPEGNAHALPSVSATNVTDAPRAPIAITVTDAPRAPIAITVNDAARMLLLDPRTVRKLFEAGSLRGNRIGRTIRLDRASVEAWLKGGQ